MDEVDLPFGPQMQMAVFPGVFFSDIVLFLILGFTFFDITNTVFIALKAYIRFNVLPHLFKDKSNVQQFQVFHR